MSDTPENNVIKLPPRPKLSMCEMVYRAAVKAIRDQRLADRRRTERNLGAFRGHETLGKPANGNAPVREVQS